MLQLKAFQVNIKFLKIGLFLILFLNSFFVFSSDYILQSDAFTACQNLADTRFTTCVLLGDPPTYYKKCGEIGCYFNNYRFVVQQNQCENDSWVTPPEECSVVSSCFFPELQDENCNYKQCPSGQFLDVNNLSPTYGTCVSLDFLAKVRVLKLPA